MAKLAILGNVRVSIFRKTSNANAIGLVTTAIDLTTANPFTNTLTAVDISNDVRSAPLTQSYNTIDTTSLADAAERFIRGIQSDGDFTVSVFVDNGTSSGWNTLSAQNGEYIGVMVDIFQSKTALEDSSVNPIIRHYGIALVKSYNLAVVSKSELTADFVMNWDGGLKKV